MRKFVVSATLVDPVWKNSTVINGDIATAVGTLREQPGGDILVNGSIQLVRTLVEHDLVDEYRLMVFPVVLGAGKRLFDETGRAIPMKPTDSRSAGECQILIYEPVREGSAGAACYFVSSPASITSSVPVM